MMNLITEFSFILGNNHSTLFFTRLNPDKVSYTVYWNDRSENRLKSVHYTSVEVVDNLNENAWKIIEVYKK